MLLVGTTSGIARFDDKGFLQQITITENVHSVVTRLMKPGTAAEDMEPELELEIEAPPERNGDRFVAQGTLRMGKPEEAAHGLNYLLGIDDDALATILQERENAIEREFMESGTAEDKENYKRVAKSSLSATELEALLQHPHAIEAKLKLIHVLVLRLYTTSSYASINNPFRTEPPTKPHPFAATCYYVNDGIKKLRVMESKVAESKIFWRGIKDTKLTEEFTSQGGTELACMSCAARLI